MQTFTAIVYNGNAEDVFRLDLDETALPSAIRNEAIAKIDGYYEGLDYSDDEPTTLQVEAITLVATGAGPVVISDDGLPAAPIQL